MKSKKLLPVLICLCVLIGVYYLVNFLFLNNYKNGDCIQSEDSYVWHINDYSFGKYSLMGWQKDSWGNQVELSKNLVEGKDYGSNIPRYHLVTCPVFGIEN